MIVVIKPVKQTGRLKFLKNLLTKKHEEAFAHKKKLKKKTYTTYHHSKLDVKEYVFLVLVDLVLVVS